MRITTMITVFGGRGSVGSSAPASIIHGSLPGAPRGSLVMPTIRPALLAWLLGGLVVAFILGGFAGLAEAVRPDRLPGLRAPAEVIRDVDGIAHVRARNEHDLFFLQGYVHAQDRLFQMDVNRRTADGTLAELLGPGALPNDVQLRTVGLDRSAERTYQALRADAAAGEPIAVGALAALEAYAEGVNAFLGQPDLVLPPEYGALEVTQVRPWKPIDSLVIGKLIAFGLSFDLEDIQNSQRLGAFQAVLGAQAGAALFFEDLFRTQPFDLASTVPDSGGDGELPRPRRNRSEASSPADGAPHVGDAIRDLARRYLERARQAPTMKTILENDRSARGSNHWGIAGSRTKNGHPILANDPHLALDHPTTFYPMHLTAPRYDATGSGFAGAPFVIVGHNRWIAWGPTTNPMDVSDVYLEQLVPDPSSPSGLSTLFQGQLEPVIPIPQQWLANVIGDGVPDNLVLANQDTTLIVPRRNNGPIVQALDGGQALSVQFTGFSATRELETFYIWNKARNLDNFRAGLRRFDFGSQNWAYADRRGNLAYFTSAEMPIRSDLAAGNRDLPPFFIRDGQSGLFEWLPLQNPQPGQVLDYEIYPESAMPSVVNPVNGFFVNANNDPAGTSLDNDPLNDTDPDVPGIFYLNPGYASGFRAGRITERLERLFESGDGRVDGRDMAEVQADVGLLDASFFVPRILEAFGAAGAPDADPALAAAGNDGRLAEVMERLAAWSALDFQAKTGIAEGFDSEDEDGDPTGSLSPGEITASVATTVYSVWRSSFTRDTILATLDGIGLGGFAPGSALRMTALRNLVENGGVSASGVDFFAAAGGAAGDPRARMQTAILVSLRDALDRLASEEFAAAFGGSDELDTYRWGRLHRIVFDSPLGAPFSVPPAFDGFPAPLPGLPGIPTDGGFGTVDAASHSATATGVNGFMFGSGPTNRMVVEFRRSGPSARSVWPGGTSAVPGDEFYLFPMLPRWLTNDANPLRFRLRDVRAGMQDIQRFRP